MRIVIIGGGPGGYEAALVAAELGADVTVVSDEGPGGACVLWDCVPSKTLLSSAQAFSTLETAPALGVHFQGVARRSVPTYEVDLPTIMDRVHDLAHAQSDDIRKRLIAEGAKFIQGTGRIADPHTVEVTEGGRVLERLDCDAILIATGSDPRGLETVKNARAASVERAGDHGVVHLEDGGTVEGTHVLLTIGQVPQTGGLGLDEVGVRRSDGGGIVVDGVSRTSVPNIYAAGDVTGKLMLASVAAMQGRIAMWH